MTTSWNCTLIDVMSEYKDELGNTKQNVIKRIWWVCLAQSNISSTQIDGYTNLDISDLSDYIPIEMITPTQLEEWVFANMTEQEKEDIITEAQSHLYDLEKGMMRELIELYTI